MNKFILFLTTTLIFSQQLKVDGNLKVEGNIDASGNPITNVGAPQAITDALNLQTLNNMMTDDGVYEYKLVMTRLGNSIMDNDNPFNMDYKNINDIGWNNDFENYINTLSLDGWKILNIQPYNYFPTNVGDLFNIYILRKPIEE